MEIVLSLLRTLVFVVATVAATVYVSRRIGRGRPLLWAGTTLLALYWLVLFGWTAYLTGSAAPNPDLGVWVGWLGHLLPFVAALAYIWGIGQAAVPPRVRRPRNRRCLRSRKRRHNRRPIPRRARARLHRADRSGEPLRGSHGDVRIRAATMPPRRPQPRAARSLDEPGAAQPAGDQPAPKTPRLAAPFAGLHAVPVVTTPSAHSAYSDDEPPKGTTKS